MLYILFVITAPEIISSTRRRVGITQAELARRTGSHQAAIARLERRGTNPRLATLDATLRALGYRLELQAIPHPAELDRAQLEAHLRLSPAERADLHDSSYANTRASLSSARRLT